MVAVAHFDVAHKPARLRGDHCQKDSDQVQGLFSFQLLTQSWQVSLHPVTQAPPLPCSSIACTKPRHFRASFLGLGEVLLLMRPIVPWWPPLSTTNGAAWV